MNRRIKLLYPFNELREYEYSLYIDGSIRIKSDLSIFFEKYISRNHEMYNFKHPNNDCIFEEMIRCICLQLGQPHKLVEQYSIYKNDGMPYKWGMSDNKIILRKNSSEIGRAHV